MLPLATADYLGVVRQSLKAPYSCDAMVIAAKDAGSWTLLLVRVPARGLEGEIRRVRSSLRDGPWCAHFFHDDDLIVVYPDATFRVGTHPSTWVEAVAHGRGLGIPAEQLDFAPRTIEGAAEEFRVRLSRETESWSATRSWVESGLSTDERVDDAEILRGGWTSDMRRLRVSGPRGTSWLVLRTFTKPFYRRHADGLLSREADVLRLLADTDVPAAELRGVDPTARDCEHPSLLMTMLPGRLRLDDEGALERSELLAEMLVRIHRVPVDGHSRPRSYQAWTSPERVRFPRSTRRPELWARAVDLIRRDPPAYRGCFLHRDFHPGNVLWDGPAKGSRISGVVDWVETSWGPADLDVAHCSTALALLHGVETGMRFADQYVAAGGKLTEDASAHLYWRLLDALAFAPDAEKVTDPWRELGRTDLTPAVVGLRLEDYVQALVERYG